MSVPWLARAGRVLLTVRVTPGASRNRIAGFWSEPARGTALSVRVAAPPVDGAANKALLDHLARVLSVRKSALSIAAGEAGRIKTIRIDGDASRIVALLEEASAKGAQA